MPTPKSAVTSSAGALGASVAERLRRTDWERRGSDASRRARPYSLHATELSRDLRIDLFAIVFAVGTIHHELEFFLEQAALGPLTEYMERWSRVIPTTGLPSSIGLALHLATIAISLLIVALPRRRELLTVLAVTFLFSQLASPDRIASHNSLMAGGLLVVSLLAVAEWLERAARRGRPASPPTDWCAWTLAGLVAACVLTYWIAYFYKLNPSWLRAGSPAEEFLVAPLAPMLNLPGVPPELRMVLGAVAVYGTLVVELALPLLLLARRTRLFGCWMGLVFHLPMVVQGVGNFPILILAFYPAFLSLDETRALLRRLFSRPSLACQVATLVLAAFCVWAFLRSRKLASMNGNASEIDVVYTAAVAASIVVLSYVTVTLGAWLLKRGPLAVLVADERERSALALLLSSRLHNRRGWRAGAAVVLFVGTTLIVLNLAPFFGLPSTGALIMYSDIRLDFGNHLLMPRTALFDQSEYVWVDRFTPVDVETREARELRAFVRWLNDQKRPPRVNLNFMRYHLSRACANAGSIELQIRMVSGEHREYTNVCAEPSMLRYWPVPAPAECIPNCGPLLRRWARGEWPQAPAQNQETAMTTVERRHVTRRVG